MKTPLFLFFTFLSICIFSACGKGKCYYYDDDSSCSNLKGNVMKVVDTVYQTQGETLYASHTTEYTIDSLNRLVQSVNCRYNVTFDEDGNIINTAVSSRYELKNRYNRDGRKVESHTCFSIFDGDSVKTMCSIRRLIKHEGNEELWEQVYDVPLPEKEYFADTRINYKYEKQCLTIDYLNDDPDEVMSTIYIYDEHKNLIESRTVSGKEKKESRTTYTYNQDNLAIEAVDTETGIRTFQYDEFDNEGNWLKQTEFDEDGAITYITHRRIEYRIPNPDSK